MPLLLRDQYHVAAVTAGYLTALAALAGSALRPVGGYVADRIGGVRLLSVLLAGIAAAYLAASRIPGLTGMVALLSLVLLRRLMAVNPDWAASWRRTPVAGTEIRKAA